MSAASIYEELETQSTSKYYDKRSGLSEDDYKQRLTTSTTLYIGNLSFYSQESQLLDLFKQAGTIKNLHMGLNKQTYKPCGFCFVEYYTRQQAQNAMELFN